MSNAWNVTEAEYRRALELSRDASTPEQDSADYWQLCRFYRGLVFHRDQAARAARLLRGSEPVVGPLTTWRTGRTYNK